MPLTIIDLQDTAVETLVKLIPMGRAGSLAAKCAKKRFVKGMVSLGFDQFDAVVERSWVDAHQMAELLEEIDSPRRRALRHLGLAGAA